jgi:transposase
MPSILYVKLTHVTCINMARNSEFVFMKTRHKVCATFTYFLITRGFHVKFNFIQSGPSH